MNIGNELAQIKNCKDFDEINKFLEDHNLKFDHWYFKGDTSDFIGNKIYICLPFEYELNGNKLFGKLKDYIDE